MGSAVSALKLGCSDETFVKIIFFVPYELYYY